MLSWTRRTSWTRWTRRDALDELGEPDALGELDEVGEVSEVDELADAGNKSGSFKGCSVRLGRWAVSDQARRRDQVSPEATASGSGRGQRQRHPLHRHQLYTEPFGHP